MPGPKIEELKLHCVAKIKICNWYDEKWSCAIDVFNVVLTIGYYHLRMLNSTIFRNGCLLLEGVYELNYCNIRVVAHDHISSLNCCYTKLCMPIFRIFYGCCLYFMLVYFTLTTCYFRAIVTSNFDIGNPMRVKTVAYFLGKNIIIWCNY